MVVTSYQGTVAAIVPDSIEEIEREEESEEDSINQLSIMKSESEKCLTDMSQ